MWIILYKQKLSFYGLKKHRLLDWKLLFTCFLNLYIMNIKLASAILRQHKANKAKTKYQQMNLYSTVSAYVSIQSWLSWYWGHHALTKKYKHTLSKNHHSIMIYPFFFFQKSSSPYIRYMRILQLKQHVINSSRERRSISLFTNLMRLRNSIPVRMSLAPARPKSI